MFGKIKDHLQNELESIKDAGLYKSERIITSSQDAVIKISTGEEVINFCANNYLGLSNNSKVIQAAKDAMDTHGYGMSSVRFICGTQDIHKELEQKIANFYQTEDTILYAAAFDANGGVFEPLLSKEDAIISDSLNHASIIDGVRLCKAARYRYDNNNMADLEKRLQQAPSDVAKMVIADSVFSMDGDIANIPALSALCKKTSSWLMIDDAHGFGTLGETGKGCLQHFSLDNNNVPIYMATLGKAMGTAGAFIAGSEELIETIIQKARTYIYTTAMPAAIAEATRCSLKIIQKEPEHLNRLNSNIVYFRSCCDESALPLSNSQTAIQPLLIGDDKKSMLISQQLFEQGFLVTAIRPPTVPEGTSRLRITLSAKHTHEHIDKLIEALVQLFNQQ